MSKRGRKRNDSTVQRQGRSGYKPAKARPASPRQRPGRGLDVAATPATKRDTMLNRVAQAISDGGRQNNKWREVNASLRSAGPVIPDQHTRNATRRPATVALKAKTQNPKTKLANPEHMKSPEAREQKKRVCKKRPEGHHPRRAGGGASKDWVPWC